LLIITGTMGAGKTTVLGEASDILTRRHVAHAAIDLDALGLSHLPSRARNDGVMCRNLESVFKNYASLGVRRFMLARAIEDRGELERSCFLCGSQRHTVRYSVVALFQPQTPSFADSPPASE